MGHMVSLTVSLFIIKLLIGLLQLVCVLNTMFRVFEKLLSLSSVNLYSYFIIYFRNARIALSEQLSKSRELTVKVGKDQEDDSEKEEEGEEEQNQSRPEEDPNNPWVLKQSKDMEDFVSGYRKYWESQGKEQEKLHNHDTSVKVNSHNEKPSAPIQKDVDKENTKPTSVNNTYIETDEIMTNATSLTVGEKKHTPLKLNEPLVKNTLTVDECCKTSSPNHDENNKFLSSVNLADALNESKNKKVSSSKTTKKSLNCSIISKMNCSVGSWIISNKKDKTLTNVNSTEGNKVRRFSNSFEVTESKTADKILETSNKTNEFDIHIREIDNERPQNKKKTLDELFEEVEDNLQRRVKNKIENIKKKINQKRKINDESDYLEHEDIPNLEIKKRITPADIDEELIQESGDKSERRTENNLSKTLKTVVGEIKQTENIDPNKFLKVTPRHLLSQIPDIMTEGEDALDDEENVADNRHLTIAEAFAEDDVVDQFKKEKEEEVKKNSVTNVDLTLPGWGSWAGHNIRPVSRRKRKKFVIKFPKAIPRKDSNRGNVIINEDADKPIKDHQVSEVPFPFTSVEEYEASIRAPLGTTWMPQSAHIKLTLPPVVTKMGTIIAPMDESQLVSKDESSSSNKKKKKPKAINKKRPNVK